MNKNKTKNTRNKVLLIINLKTYLEGSGRNAVKLAKICAKIQKEYKNCEIMLAAQAADIFRITKDYKIKVLAQHVDNIDAGAHTGKVLIQTIKDNGAAGTLINHSENQLKLKDIENTIKRCKENKMFSVVCATNERIGKAIATLNPDVIAIEPPELIGTKNSVSKTKPELIKQSVKAIKETNPNIKVLCGAGINTMMDVYKALELGSEGILVASAIVKAKDPEKKIRQFCDAVNKFLNKKKKY